MARNILGYRFSELLAKNPHLITDESFSVIHNSPGRYANQMNLLGIVLQLSTT